MFWKNWKNTTSKLHAVTRKGFKGIGQGLIFNINH